MFMTKALARALVESKIGVEQAEKLWAIVGPWMRNGLVRDMLSVEGCVLTTIPPAGEDVPMLNDCMFEFPTEDDALEVRSAIIAASATA